VGKKNMRLLAVETSGRRDRYRENGTMLGSCLPLGWTLVPFRLRLEWHLANVFGGGHFPLSTAFVCPCFDLKLPSQNQDENCRYIF